MREPARLPPAMASSAWQAMGWRPATSAAFVDRSHVAPLIGQVRAACSRVAARHREDHDCCSVGGHTTSGRTASGRQAGCTCQAPCRSRSACCVGYPVPLQLRRTQYLGRAGAAGDRSTIVPVRHGHPAFANTLSSICNRMLKGPSSHSRVLFATRSVFAAGQSGACTQVFQPAKGGSRAA
jgi:hypothetical protein